MNLLISIEGGEYVGKTTLVAPALKEIFNRLGFVAEVSREPGGTAEGEKMRQLIFEKAEAGADAKTLLILFNKARKIHIDGFIKPFFQKNEGKKPIVILDRFLDSSRVYQGLEGGVDLEEIKKLEEEYVNGFFPNLVLILYFPEDVFKGTYLRRKGEANLGRYITPWDNSDVETNLRRQEYYLSLPALAQKWGEDRDFEIIDASVKPSEVVLQSLKACIPHLLKLELSLTENKIMETFAELEKEGYFEKLLRR
jgi:dTMP kinase